MGRMESVLGKGVNMSLPQGGSPAHLRYAGYDTGPQASPFQHNLGWRSHGRGSRWPGQFPQFSSLHTGER